LKKVFFFFFFFFFSLAENGINNHPHLQDFILANELEVTIVDRQDFLLLAGAEVWTVKKTSFVYFLFLFFILFFGREKKKTAILFSVDGETGVTTTEWAS